jgi:hypothetical protein
VWFEYQGISTSRCTLSPTYLDIVSWCFIPNRHSRNQPWSFRRLVCDFRRVRHTRGETSIPTYRLLFAHLTSAYRNNMAVYTDRSFVQGSTESAFVYGDEDIPHTSFTVQITCMVYKAELYAICRDNLFVRQRSRWCYILCRLLECLAESPETHARPSGRFGDSAASVPSSQGNEVWCNLLGTWSHSQLGCLCFPQTRRCVRKFNVRPSLA